MAAKDAVSIRAREYYYLQYIIIRFQLLMKSIFIKTRVRAPPYTSAGSEKTYALVKVPKNHSHGS
jgi:hypothetical protein